MLAMVTRVPRSIVDARAASESARLYSLGAGHEQRFRATFACSDPTHDPDHRRLQRHRRGAGARLCGAGRLPCAGRPRRGGSPRWPGAAAPRRRPRYRIGRRDRRAPGAGWIERVDDAAPLDLVIANAGISAGTGGGAETAGAGAADLRASMSTACSTPCCRSVPRMPRAGRGQIALMSSLAGFRGLPGAPAYCASKAAVRVWGEALRGDLVPPGRPAHRHLPGFVETPMTDDEPLPDAVADVGGARGRHHQARPRARPGAHRLPAAHVPGHATGGRNPSGADRRPAGPPAAQGLKRSTQRPLACRCSI